MEIILIGLFVCHFLADYTHLSTDQMLSAKRLGKQLGPIAYHALVHALLMLAFLIISTRIDLKLFYAIIFQFATHFIIDTLKGRMNGWFPSLQSPANKWHWVLFGFDQLLHAIVIIVMAASLIS